LGKEQDSLVSPIRLAKNGLSIATKALIDTRANGYTFMDIFLAIKLAQHFQTHIIPLEQPCAVKGYDSKTTMPITHLIHLTLKIQRRVQQNLPFLIVELGKHNIILRQMWLAKHGVLINCRHHQLLWPEEVSLKDKLLSKQDLFIPKSILS
jgi:hypothetical protein